METKEGRPRVFISVSKEPEKYLAAVIYSFEFSEEVDMSGVGKAISIAQHIIRLLEPFGVRVIAKKEEMTGSDGRLRAIVFTLSRKGLERKNLYDQEAEHRG